MTDPILYEFPDPDKPTKRQKRTILLAMEAFAFGVPRDQITRYVADREGVGLRAVQKLLKRAGINIKDIPSPEKPLSEKRQWELDHPDMRRCTKCGIVRPATLEYFGPTKKNSVGLNSYCRDCERKYLRSRYHLTRSRTAAWQKANPEKRRTAVNRRRARLLQAKGSHTAADIRAQYNSQRGKCWWCGEKVGKKYDVDHRIPLSRGGSNAAENLVIACVRCNRSKNARMPWEWSDRLL